MKEELKDLITKHLPSLAAGEMSKYIEQAEKTKKDYDEVSDKYTKLLAVHSDLKNRWDMLTAKQSEIQMKELEIDKRTTDLNLKEFNLKVAELTYQLEAEKQSKTSIYNLVNSFVANPRAIEITSRNRSYVSATDYFNGGQHRYPVSSSEFENKEIKEQK